MSNLEFLEFDATTAEDMSFQPIPIGDYHASIIESKMKPTKNGDGEYLELKFSILDGDYTGRKLWMRLNVKNPNPEAVKFAKSDLAMVCKATDVIRPRDSSEFHDIPMVITVGVDKTGREEIKKCIVDCPF